MQTTQYRAVKAQVKALISDPKKGLAAEYRLLNWLLKRDWRRWKDAGVPGDRPDTTEELIRKITDDLAGNVSVKKPNQSRSAPDKKLTCRVCGRNTPFIEGCYDIQGKFCECRDCYETTTAPTDYSQKCDNCGEVTPLWYCGCSDFYESVSLKGLRDGRMVCKECFASIEQGE